MYLCTCESLAFGRVFIALLSQNLPSTLLPQTALVCPVHNRLIHPPWAV